MKHYSHSWAISYNVIILVCYFQCQRNNLTIFEFLVLWGVGFKVRKLFRTGHIIRKQGVAGSSIFKVIAIIKFIQVKNHICNFC